MTGRDAPARGALALSRESTRRSRSLCEHVL
jgi:hypothetical protein